MDTKKINIIFAGCSFSDDGRNQDLFDLHNMRNKPLSYFDIGLPNSVKTHFFLASDLIEQKNENVVIHTIARGSYGNHVIFDKLKEKVEEIKSNNKDEKIYAIIQLSGLFREGIMKNLDIDTKKYPYDYLDFDNMSTISYEESTLYHKHFDNIENIDEFCKNNNIEKLIYFGWANLFNNDIELFNLKTRIDKIKSIVNFFEYKDEYDEISFYCTGRKMPIKIENEYSFGDNNLYLTKGDSFGGLCEYVKSKTKIGERYWLIFDPHPSSKAYKIFYEDIIRGWLIENNIIENKPYNIDFINKVNKIIEIEYIKFTKIINLKNHSVEEISKLTYRIFKENLENNIDVINELYDRLNRKLK
jgi:hypothetical protein